MSEVGGQGELIPAAPQNPIETLDPVALNELFDRDPEQLTDADLDTIIKYFRSERAQWQQAEATGTTRKVSAAKRKEAAPKGSVQVNLDDLQL